MTVKQRRIGVIPPPGTDILDSLNWLCASFHAVVSSCGDVERLPNTVLPDSGDRLDRFISRCDAVFVWLPLRPSMLRRIFEARNRTSPETALFYLPLGELQLGGVWLRAVRDMLRPHDRILVNSTTDGAIARRLVDGIGALVRHFPFWIDNTLFAPLSRDDRQAARAAMDIPDEAVVFLYTGRIVADKNIHGLLATFSALAAAHPQAYLLVVGASDDTPLGVFRQGPFPLSKELEQLRCSDPNLSKRCRFLPRLDDPAAMARLYGAADVFMTLSLHSGENFGLALVEAMSASLPVIASDWGGHRDTVAAGETGFLVRTKPGSIGHTADLWQAHEAMAQLVADSGMRKRMGDAGRCRVRRLYAVGGLAERLDTLLSEPAAAPLSLRLTVLGQTLSTLFADRESRDMLPDFGPGDRALYGVLTEALCSTETPDPSASATQRLFLVSPFVLQNVDDGRVGLWNPLGEGLCEVEGAEAQLLARMRHRTFWTEEALMALAGPDAAQTIIAMRDAGLLEIGTAETRSALNTA